MQEASRAWCTGCESRPAGLENGVEDNESILRADERLQQARDRIDANCFADGSRIEQVFLPGDVFTTILRSTTTSTSRTKRGST